MSNNLKTVQKTVEIKKLKITYDTDSMTPREWDGHLGYIVKNDKLSNLSDKVFDNQKYQEDTSSILKVYSIDYNNSQEFKYTFNKDITKQFIDDEDDNYNDDIIYIITKKSLEATGLQDMTDEKLEESITKELKTFSQWCNGETYQFVLYDNMGELEDSCGGFYSLEEIKDNLPKEWQDVDLSDYTDF